MDTLGKGSEHLRNDPVGSVTGFCICVILTGFFGLIGYSIWDEGLGGKVLGVIGYTIALITFILALVSGWDAVKGFWNSIRGNQPTPTPGKASSS